MLWPADTFVATFDISPEDAGYKHFVKELPDGSSLSGYRTPAAAWPAGKPLPAGVTEIRRDVVVHVGMESKTFQSEDMNKGHMKEHMQMLARRSLGTQNDGPAVDLSSLLNMKKNKASRLHNEAEPSGRSTGQKNFCRRLWVWVCSYRNLWKSF